MPKEPKVLQKITITVFDNDESKVTYRPGIPDVPYTGGHGRSTYDRVEAAVDNLVQVVRAVR